MMTNSKCEWRRLLLLRRRALPGQHRHQQAQTMATHLVEQVMPWLGTRGLVAGYMAMGAEPDLMPHWRRMGISLALPAVRQGQLSFQPWCWGEPLEADDCGVPAPQATAPMVEPEAMDLLLIPAVAMHPQGFRLGYGGGWYDRLLSQPNWARRPSLGVCFSCCAAVPFAPDSWDRPLHGQVTELGVHWWRNPQAVGQKT